MMRVTKRSMVIVAGVAGLLMHGVVHSALAQTPAADFALLSAEAASIERHNAYLEKSMSAQLGELQSLQDQIAGIDATGAAAGALLQRIFTDLETFITGDLPFKTEERTKALDKLRDMMASTDTQPGEKYRRLMEAYQIELEYGRTMESYGGDITGKGPVRFLRLGRVALMYMTVDGAETGYWDKAARTWVQDSEYDADIQKAIRIALQELTADLVTLPLPAAVPVR